MKSLILKLVILLFKCFFGARFLLFQAQHSKHKSNVAFLPSVAGFSWEWWHWIKVFFHWLMVHFPTWPRLTFNFWGFLSKWYCRGMIYVSLKTRWAGWTENWTGLLRHFFGFQACCLLLLPVVKWPLVDLFHFFEGGFWLFSILIQEEVPEQVYIVLHVLPCFFSLNLRLKVCDRMGYK